MSQAPNIPPELGLARERFLELVSEVRPELHRYCARITGSAVDGEDIVQEALARSFYAMSLATEIPPLRPFLFKVAHNMAIDFLRRYEKKHVEPSADIDETAGAEAPMDPEVLRAALGSFLDLPIAQRSAVILKDVLGPSGGRSCRVLPGASRGSRPCAPGTVRRESIHSRARSAWTSRFARE